MRKEFVQCMSKKEAVKECPWTSEIRKAVGGFWCFESVSDAKLWDKTK